MIVLLPLLIQAAGPVAAPPAPPERQASAKEKKCEEKKRAEGKPTRLELLRAPKPTPAQRVMPGLY